MKLCRFLLFPLFLALITPGAFSQTATIKGFVYDKESGEPMIFTTVYLTGTSYGTTTDVNGFFQLAKIPAGNYTLITSYVGYDTAKVSLSLKAGELVSHKLFLLKGIKLKTFEVSAEKEENKTEVKMSVAKITPKEIKSIPSIGGDPDLAQYLQVLPGVIFTGDQGGQLYIRGGSPIQNKVLLDGLVIYNPFHSIGLFSVFDTDIIRNADIYTGGYGAKYGGRISSIMDITTKDGNKRRHTGKVSASTFAAKAMLEGPISKQKEDDGGGSVSYVVTGKHSYLNESSKLLYSYIDTAGLPFRFTDLYGKISMNADNGSKLNLFGFNFRDGVSYKNVSDLNWNALGGGANFVFIPGQSKTLIDGVIAYSDYKITLVETDSLPRESSINGINAGMNFTNYFGNNNEVRYGIEFVAFETDFNFFNTIGRKISQAQNTSEISGYVNWRINSGKFVFEPGFRMQYYSSLATASPEPRLAIKYNISDHLRFKVASGLYSQNLISATSDRDVVNLFYGFLSGPDNLQEKFTDEKGNTKNVKHKLQKAAHLVGGFEIDINKSFTINIEGYFKRFSQLTNINRNKIFDDNVDNATRPELLRKDFIIETGDAYGADLVIRYDLNHINLYAVYSIAKVTRWDGIATYAPIFDRRHNANFTVSYNFGKDLNWEVDARWNLGSGFPFTQTQAFYENITFNNGINTDYTTSNGDLKIQYAEINKGRLPYYHRLDLTGKRKFVLNNYSILEIVVSVTNAYNRENIFYFNRVTYERVNQLPLMPSLGISLTF